jgi:hypothetical protein
VPHSWVALAVVGTNYLGVQTYCVTRVLKKVKSEEQREHNNHNISFFVCFTLCMRPKEIGLLIQYLFILQFKTSICFSIASTAAFRLKRIEMSVDSNEKYLTPITPDQVRLEIKDPVDPTALTQAKDILKELRTSDDETTLNGTVDPTRLMSVAKKLGDIPAEMATYVATKEECKAAFDGLSDVERLPLKIFTQGSWLLRRRREKV